MTYTRKRRRLPALLDHTPERRHRRELPHVDGRPAIVAVVRNAVRQKMDAALGELKSLVHVESVGDALQRVRETPVSVLLVSPEILKSGETALLSKTLSTTARAVAVLDDGQQDAALLLRLGACGMTEAVDLRNCEGWNDLRKLLHDETDPVAGRIASVVFHHLDGAAPGARRFFAHLVRGARATRTARAFAGRLGILPSTLMSRFYRASLPSPKTLLAATRLLFARALLEAIGDEGAPTEKLRDEMWMLLQRFAVAREDEVTLGYDRLVEARDDTVRGSPPDHLRTGSRGTDP